MLTNSFNRFSFVLFLVGVGFTLLSLLTWLMDDDILLTHKLYSERYSFEENPLEIGLINRIKEVQWLGEGREESGLYPIINGYKGEAEKKCVLLRFIQEQQKRNSLNTKYTKTIIDKIKNTTFPKVKYGIQRITALDFGLFGYIEEECIKNTKVKGEVVLINTDYVIKDLYAESITLKLGGILMLFGALLSILWPIWGKPMQALFRWIKGP